MRPAFVALAQLTPGELMQQDRNAAIVGVIERVIDAG